MEYLQKLREEQPLFKAFENNVLKELLKNSELKTFAQKESIIRFGQTGEFLGIMIEGKAEAVITGEDGERQQIGILNPGDIFGEMSLLTGEPTSADVIAMEPCNILLIPQEIFSTFLAVNSTAVKVMAKTITERLKRREEDATAQARIKHAWASAQDPYGLSLSTTNPMKILVINCGSSSLKYSYFDTTAPANNIDGLVDMIGLESPRLISTSRSGRIIKELGRIDHAEGLKIVIDHITDPDQGVLKSLNELTAVGHRVVHGGERYSASVIIDDEVVRNIEEYSSLAPLHNPLNLMAIRESMKLMPNIPQVAVFDTGFHQKMPHQAYLYGLPYEYYEKFNIRRYGFHGISHNYVALQAAGYLKRNFREIKIITCHLGNGTSVCAIDHGRSVDTSMGMTPLEGLIMGTRCGDIDPSIVIYLMREKGLSIDEVDKVLNRQSGLIGLSGISSDFRKIEEAANKGDTKALMAIQAFCYRIRKYIGAYLAAMGGLDVLVFTGGIGEGSAWVRSLACQGLSNIGIITDDIQNRIVSSSLKDVTDISNESSLVKVLVIHTDEGRMIARETINAINYQYVTDVIKKQEKKEIPIEVSAHHVHLAQSEIDTLFGKGYQLTQRSELSQPGQFACQELVNLIGPRGKVEHVRILGPSRNQSQVEISMTEEFKLGIKAPIRASGDLDGTPGISLEGPDGICELSQGVICAARHIHMSPEDALSFGLKDNDICMVKVQGARTLIYGDVLVRVNPNFRLSMHIDTDEANAAYIQTGMIGNLVSVQDRR
jgi:acetate kinase